MGGGAEARGWSPGPGVGEAQLRADGSPGPPPLLCPLFVPAEGPSPVTCEFRNCLLGPICPAPEPQVWPPANLDPSPVSGSCFVLSRVQSVVIASEGCPEGT